MASSGDIKIYRSLNTGKGGAIDTATLIVSGNSNNLFTNLTAATRVAGTDEYQCIYLKNTSTEEMNDVFFWLSFRNLENHTVWRFARGSSGRNGTEQTIATINTAPTGVTWRELSEIPFTPMISTFDAGDIYPLWIWRHVEATVFSDEHFSVKDDPCVFNGAFRISAGGTGTPGTPPGEEGPPGGGGNPPPAVANYRMIFVGDEGCENATEDVITLIQGLIDALPETTPILLCSVGDHAYESASCWTTAWQTFKDQSPQVRFISAYGNHEYEESGGINPYKTFFGHSKTYYSQTFENVGIIVMDTNIDIDQSSSTQGDFVNQALSDYAGSSTIKWRFVVMHHPWFVDGSRNEANEFNQIQEWHQEFIDNKISMVITGHNHNWQRTHQIGYNSGNPLNAPNIIDSTAPYSSTAAGLIHVVTGGGGHDSGTGLYQLPSQPSFQAYQSRQYNGVWVVDASNNGATLTCYFMNTDNSAFDNFVINL